MEQTIVAIHGYGFDQRVWSPVELAFEGYQVVYLSLPGFGDDAPEHPYSIESLAQQYWSALGPDDVVHLVGHSMGGYVCLEMAAQQSSRVASLALVHSHVFADPVEKKAQRTATMEEIKASGINNLVGKMMPSLLAEPDRFPELVKALVSRGLRYGDSAWSFGAGAMRDRRDHSETLKGLRVPVLMLGGEKDKAVPLELVYQQAGFVERNSFHVYPGVGHLAMYENTAQMICDLIAFYADVIPGYGSD